MLAGNWSIWICKREDSSSTFIAWFPRISSRAGRFTKRLDCLARLDFIATRFSAYRRIPEAGLRNFLVPRRSHTQEMRLPR